VPASAAQRVWFPEMIEKLRAVWKAGVSLVSLIELRDVLDSMLCRIRSTGGIRPPVFKRPVCGKTGRGAEPKISVRAMILSLARFGIAKAEETRILDREWTNFRKQNQLDLYGKVMANEFCADDCGHPNVR